MCQIDKVTVKILSEPSQAPGDTSTTLAQGTPNLLKVGQNIVRLLQEARTRLARGRRVWTNFDRKNGSQKPSGCRPSIGQVLAIARTSSGRATGNPLTSSPSSTLAAEASLKLSAGRTAPQTPAELLKIGRGPHNRPNAGHTPAENVHLELANNSAELNS